MMPRTVACIAFAVLLVSGVASPAAIRDDAAVPEDPAHFHIFLLVGQSNMAGRGAITPQDLVPHPRVQMLTKEGTWQPAVAPLHFDKPKVAGVGLGRTFALDYAHAHPDCTVGLVPCAAGGSPIESWQPGGYHKQTDSHPYDDAIRRASQALQSGTLKGILWHQGESDSTAQRSEVYESKLHSLIARFRRDLNAPEVPFLVGQLGQFVERPWTEDRGRVNAAHQQLPSRVPITAFVSSEGLTHRGDRTHFDSTSYREFGHRYFDAYQELVGGWNETQLRYTIELSVIRRGFDGQRCWVHARAGVIPPAGRGGGATTPLALLTTQQLLLSGSDVFYALHGTRSTDGGKTWSPLRRYDSFARQPQPTDREVTVCDFTPKWHAQSGTLLGTGQTVWYADNRVMRVRPRSTAYAVYDPRTDRWSPWQRLKMPDTLAFQNAGAGSTQRLDLENGDILLPIYFKNPEQKQYSVTVCRCRYDGTTLEYVKHGNTLTVEVERGLAEPSLTRFDGRFFLTLRNDEKSYVTTSSDGLQFGPVRVWKFDDGQELGCYNTQQHWVSHSEGLYLVYTRRGANNDHVFRHRAPLFIARVDPQKLCVIRRTERILVPQRGARLGNFGVVHVGPRETWITVAEWMQPEGVEQYGSDNSIFVAKLLWNHANRTAAQ